VRAELAKEEYATTWQEEEQGEPQVIGVANGGTLNARASGGITQDQRTQGSGSKRGGSEGRG
jgi:hypothetical protein